MNAETPPPQPARRGTNTFRLTAASIFWLLALLPLGRAALSQQPKSVARFSVTPHPFDVTVSSRGLVKGTLQPFSFSTIQPVHIVLRDSITGDRTTIDAADAAMDAEGDLIVRGAARIVNSAGILQGTALNYSPSTSTGSVTNATFNASHLHVKGEKLEITADGTLRATNAWFTTCDISDPHYHLTAGKLEVNRNRRLSAHKVTLYAGHVRLITIPSLTHNSTETANSPLPLPGYSADTGPSLRMLGQPVSKPTASVEYNLLFSIRRSPQGTIAYEQSLDGAHREGSSPRTHLLQASNPLASALDLNPTPELPDLVAQPPPPRPGLTLYALTALNTSLFNRTRTDLRLSRLPEFGVHFAQVPTAFIAGGTRRSALTPSTWYLSADLGIGNYTEEPTDATAGRASLMLQAATPTVPVRRALYARFAVSSWINYYSSGTAYMLTSPEFELNYLLSPRNLTGVTYRYQADAGHTPFQFDHLDFRHTAALRFRHLGMRWGIDLSLYVDMQELRAFDGQISVRRRLDCLEYGASYRVRSRSLQLVFGIFPFFK